jgi:hypothetical protein
MKTCVPKLCEANIGAIKIQVFVNEFKRNRKAESKAVNIKCLGEIFVQYGCMSYSKGQMTL